MTEKLQRLIIARGQVKGTITKMFNFTQGDKFKTCEREVLLTRRQRLIAAFQEYCTLNIDVLVLDPENDEDFPEVEEKYLAALAKFEAKLVIVPKEEPSIGTQQRLPRINICKFSGQVGNYIDFINLFRSIIDSNSQLSSSDKFYYLKSYVEGEAADLIRHLSLDAENYKVALQLLDDRYNNKNKIVNFHINSILDLKPIKRCTSAELRELISQTRQHLGALENMKIPTKQWDLIIICILQRKIDQYTLRSFHLELKDDTPELNMFLKFLEQRASALETVAESSSAQACHGSSRAVNTSRGASLATTARTGTPLKCRFCDANYHKLHQCDKFKLASLSERFRFVKKHNLCHLCLRGHTDKCTLSFRCTQCKQKHNSLLHEENADEVLKQVALSMSKNNDILLPTIKVKLFDKNGKETVVRALCDSGSQVSFILSELVDDMSCKITNKPTSISGICEGKNKITKQATLQVYSTTNNNTLRLNCCVVPKITCELPQFQIDKNIIKVPSHLILADPNFYEKEKIGMLLGCDVFFDILLREQYPVVPGGLHLQNTAFGYMAAGKIPHTSTSDPVSNFVSIIPERKSDSIESLENTMNKFWKCEDVPEVFTEASTEQELAEKVFVKSVVLKNNKFEVDLPLKQNLEDINMGNSLSRSLQRFHNLEKRFKKDPALFRKYKDFIGEYVSLGHAKYLDLEIYDLESGQVYFLPHHPVINENSQTTKLRVVFDGSMFTNLGFSLNDMLLNGPCIQNELFNILILFRLHKFILITDIQKMFRQINITPEQCCLQNILWRDTPEESIKCLQLSTVTYGLKSSTFLATRCLAELAYRYKDQFPLAAPILLQNTYVDDIIFGDNNIENLLEMKKQLIELLKLGGFSLHKWTTNNEELLNDGSSISQKEKQLDLCKSETHFVKTLGMTYDMQTDTLNISSPQLELLESYTKRQVLSFMSKLFDPLGLVGPIVVLAKIIMQKTWLAKINWDTPLPSDLNKEFKNFIQSLLWMGTIKIKRNIDTSNAKIVELLGFADASSKAYGCNLYLRVIDKNNRVQTALLCSKSRVNPIKPLSIPRLELNSALLLAKLTKKVYEQLNNSNIKMCVHLYLDSQIVLAWLKTQPEKLSVYVANRIKSIMSLTEGFEWSYINTAENPADYVSRGLEAHLLQEKEVWWNGPNFAQDPSYSHSQKCEVPVVVPEMKAANTVTINPDQNSFDLISKYSDINKLKRVLAYIYRFYNNCKLQKEKRNFGHISCKELNFALNKIIKIEQSQHFSAEIQSLLTNQPVQSNLKSLNPFLDGQGLLRVGGRLQNANLQYNQQHPIILPKKSILTDLLISNEHRLLLHASQKLIFASLSQHFYLVNGIREIKRVIHKCITCFRLKAKAAEQLMGSLPADRVNPSRPFQKVGIDYGGPFSIKMHRVRKPLIYKAYILLFVCFTTKAIHIELASNLTTECFLQCLKRFISRRNKPSIIYCDNASTFKGAKNELNELYKLHSSKSHQNAVINQSLDLGIEFKFIPSYSPVFGGLWEAGIKSAKYHIKRVVGQQILTYEELNSVIIQIEGILNSRPILSLKTTDPNDMSYLTPAHFLTGESLTSYPDTDLNFIPVNRLSFWQKCTQITQTFWKTWSKQYLTQLQNRPKWHKDVPNIEIGSLVILRNDNTSPLSWPMARVECTYPGPDGKVRALSVRTNTGAIIRTSVTKVCILPIEEK